MIASIIIPVSRAINEKYLDSWLNQDMEEYELVLVVNKKPSTKPHSKKQKIIFCDDKNPSTKRNKGVKNSVGEFLLFTDDDCLLPKNWLRKMIISAKKNRVDMVCGSNIAPKKQGLNKEISSALLSSGFGSGWVRKYSDKGKIIFNPAARYVMSCNLLIKRNAFLDISGYNEAIGFIGEDDELYLRLRKKGYLCIFDPECLVFHQRRRFPLEHMSQMFAYASGKILAMRKSGFNFLDQSLVIAISLSLFFVVSLSLGFGTVSKSLLMIYFLLAFVFSAKISLKSKKPSFFIILPPAFLLHHCSYLIGIIWGFVKQAKKT